MGVPTSSTPMTPRPILYDYSSYIPGFSATETPAQVLQLSTHLPRGIYALHWCLELASGELIVRAGDADSEQVFSYHRNSFGSAWKTVSGIAIVDQPLSSHRELGLFVETTSSGTAKYRRHSLILYRLLENWRR